VSGSAGEALLWGAMIFSLGSLLVGAPLLAKYFLRPPAQQPEERDGDA
jgi:hypothetical protein